MSTKIKDQIHTVRFYALAQDLHDDSEYILDAETFVMYPAWESDKVLQAFADELYYETYGLVDHPYGFERLEYTAENKAKAITCYQKQKEQLELELKDINEILSMMNDLPDPESSSAESN